MPKAELSVAPAPRKDAGTLLISVALPLACDAVIATPAQSVRFQLRLAVVVPMLRRSAPLRAARSRAKSLGCESLSAPRPKDTWLASKVTSREIAKRAVKDVLVPLRYAEVKEALAGNRSA